jgi:hypothetical protein
VNEINSNLLTKLKKEEDNSENFNTIETIVNCRLLQTQSSEFNKSTANDNNIIISNINGTKRHLDVLTAN